MAPLQTGPIFEAELQNRPLYSMDMKGKAYFVLVIILLEFTSIWADGGANHRVRQARPIRLGTSGGNNRDITSEFCCSGTLGALVRDASGARYILSNNHVMANNNQGRPGENIGQPGLIDVNCRVSRADPVASLTRFARIFFDSANRIDAAIARILPGKVNLKGRILDIGRPGPPVHAQLGMDVKKSGRTTGRTIGRIISLNTSVRVDIPQFCGDDAGRTARFVDQLVVEPTTSRPFTRSGDSGALVVTRRRTCPQAVGLLFAGDEEGFGIANKIQTVLSAFNVTIVGCTNASATNVKPQGTSLDPDVKRVEQVRQRNEERLFHSPGVVGVGIGMNGQSRTGYTITIFVKKGTMNSSGSIPANVDGYPTKIVTTSGFKTQCSIASGT